MQSKYAKSDRIFVRFGNPKAQVVGFWATIRRLGSSVFFSNGNMEWSLNSRCYPRRQAAAERSMSDELDGDAAV